MNQVEVAINGFGRIGRTLFRALMVRPHLTVTQINDLMPIETIAHLLAYDTVYGPYGQSIEIEGNSIITGGKRIRITHKPCVANLPEKDFAPHIWIDATGKKEDRKAYEKLPGDKTRAVILSRPASEIVDRTVIFGINEDSITLSDRILSNASCTSNCVGPLLDLIHGEFGIGSVFLNNMHPCTNSQNLLDSPHDDLRRARSAACNIIPTATLAIESAVSVMPFLKDRFDGISTRVPVYSGALAELVLVLNRNCTVSHLNELVREASMGRMRGIIQYISDPVVSSDLTGNPHSCVFDSLLTKVINGNTAQVFGWYDNEYGYSSRIADLAGKIAEIHNLYSQV